jgi:hypothetical protein
MTENLMKAGRVLILAAATALAAGAALAEKPSWAGEGKGKGHAKKAGGKSAKHFTAEHRGFVKEYYADEWRSGRCPPGLAKKRNGCLPPGQAKKWKVGQPLPRDVVFYELPPAVVVKLGPPPAGHKYVRVAADILMIAVGTNMVVDALSDLSRL